VLAVAAPSSWHRYRSAPQTPVEEFAITELVEPESGPTAAPPIEQSLFTPPKFDLGVLLQMRDALFEIVDRLPTQEQKPESTTKERSVLVTSKSVLVTSEHDRLAMLDTRQRSRVDTPSRIEPEPSIEQPSEAQPVQPLVRHRPGVLFKQLKTLVDAPQAWWKFRQRKPTG